MMQWHNPHAFLGLHGVVRLWRPGAESAYLVVKDQVVEAKKKEPGLFEYHPPSEIGPKDYFIYRQNGELTRDPYTFLPFIGGIDLFLFNKGCHYQLDQILGAHIREMDGVKGVGFALWAPNAVRVGLVGDFNSWNGLAHPMRSMGGSGIWELFIPGLAAGEKYKFEIQTREGSVCLKSDPFAFFSELRPKTASIVFDTEEYQWKDKYWIDARSKASLNRPINIYELHLGSWKSSENEFPNYRDMAFDLAKYCLEMGFTHVELLPIMEHPLDESWGYQVTGFFSVTSRYGTPADFQFFVDHLHQSGIGVILDWVPAHFPMDDFSLSRFDGTALFEHEDPRKGIHPHWHTAIFNYGRKEVSNFLIASALYWIGKMHVDGLRVDAVASILFLDYGRKEGEWIPNSEGGRLNLEGIEFLKHLNGAVHELFPGVLMLAEESSSYEGVTEKKGLGFDLKWNMGWMNDTLRYFSKDPIYRSFHQNDLTFSMLYIFSEKFISVLSHDEVVHGKGSILEKMPGPDWEKFANVRLLYSYMMCHPGKKLLFMGAEIGQRREWDCKGAVEWFLLQYPQHQGLYEMVKEINHFYLSNKALWEDDFDWKGFSWVDFSDQAHSVISYLRGKNLLIIHHFAPGCLLNYSIPLKGVKKIRECFNTDAQKYGGSNQINQEITIKNDHLILSLAPLATMIFEVEFA